MHEIICFACSAEFTLKATPFRHPNICYSIIDKNNLKHYVKLIYKFILYGESVMATPLQYFALKVLWTEWSSAFAKSHA